MGFSARARGKFGQNVKTGGDPIPFGIFGTAGHDEIPVDRTLYDWYVDVPEMLIADLSVMINTGDSAGRRKITHNGIEILTRREEAGGNSGQNLLIDPNTADTRVVVNAGAYENWDMATIPFSNAQMAYTEAVDYIQLKLRRDARVVIAHVGGSTNPTWLNDANGWAAGDATLTYSFNGGANQAMTTRIKTLTAGTHIFPGFDNATTGIDHWTIFVAESDGTPTDPTSGIPTKYASAVPAPQEVIRPDSIWHNLHWAQGDDGLWYKTFHDQQDQRLGYFYGHDHGSRPGWFADQVVNLPDPPKGEYAVSLDPLWNYTALRDPDEGLELLRAFKVLTFEDPDTQVAGMWLFNWETGGADRIPPPYNPDGRQWMTLDFWMADQATGDLLAALHFKTPMSYSRWNYPSYNNNNITGGPNQQVMNAEVGTNMGIFNPPVATNGTGYWSAQINLLFASLFPWHSDNNSGFTLTQDNPLGRFQVRAYRDVNNGLKTYSEGDIVQALPKEDVPNGETHYDKDNYYVRTHLHASETEVSGTGDIEMIHFPFGTTVPGENDASGNPDDQQGTARWFIIPGDEPLGIDTTALTQRAGTHSGFFYTDYTGRFLLDRDDPLAVRQYVKPNVKKHVAGDAGRYLALDGYDAVYRHREGGDQDIRVWRNRANKIANTLGKN